MLLVSDWLRPTRGGRQPIGNVVFNHQLLIPSRPPFHVETHWLDMQVAIVKKCLHGFSQPWPKGQQRSHDHPGTLGADMRDESQLRCVIDEASLLKPFLDRRRSTKQVSVLFIHKVLDDRTDKMLKHSETFLDTVVGGPGATTNSLEVM